MTLYRETRLLTYWRELNAARKAIGRHEVELGYAQVCLRRSLSPSDAAKYKLL